MQDTIINVTTQGKNAIKQPQVKSASSLTSTPRANYCQSGTKHKKSLFAVIKEILFLGLHITRREKKQNAFSNGQNAVQALSVSKPAFDYTHSAMDMRNEAARNILHTLGKEQFLVMDISQTSIH